MDEPRHDSETKFLVVGVFSDADWVILSQHASHKEASDFIEAIRPRSRFMKLRISVYDRAALVGASDQ